MFGPSTRSIPTKLFPGDVWAERTTALQSSERIQTMLDMSEDEITSDKGVLRYGVELDAGRTEQARGKGSDLVHGNC